MADQPILIRKHIAITKSILQYLNELAIKNGYNRQLAEWIFSARPMGELDCIDDRFPIFLKMSMPHYHKEGVRCETHYRTIWEVVMASNTDTTTTLVVDIPSEAFKMLPEVPEVMNIDNDEVITVWENLQQNEKVSTFIKDVEKLLQDNAINEEEE